MLELFAMGSNGFLLTNGKLQRVGHGLLSESRMLLVHSKSRSLASSGFRTVDGKRVLDRNEEATGLLID